MADKQPQLNGAYYGPTIPPPESARHHSHGGRSCCCCLFSFFWKLVLAIVVLFVVIFFISWVVIQPRGFRLHVTDAKLTHVNYTGNTLHYNLVLNFTARNPNKKLNIYYDQVEAHASYEGVRFASMNVVTRQNSFRQHTKSTDRMSGVFSGERVMVLVLEEDGSKKDFDIDVRLEFHIRFGLGDYQDSSGTKAKAKCELEVPLSSKGTTVTPLKVDVSMAPRYGTSPSGTSLNLKVGQNPPPVRTLRR